MIRNASQDTLFGKADDKLSRLASALYQENKDLHERLEDADAHHAPGEIYRDISRHHDERTALIIFAEGFTEESLYEAFRERTTHRFIYFSGILM